MIRWSGKVAVVTGASSGIGAWLIEDLAKYGVIVVGLARRKDRIEKIAAKAANSPGKIHAIECDITNTESIVEAFKWIQHTLGKVHILINNAGRSKIGALLDASIPHEEILATINVNLSGLVVCTREAFKSMDTHNEPSHIININSIAGHNTPSMLMLPSNIYAATKHAVTNHTEQLRLELVNAGKAWIRVTSLSPGVVRSDFLAAGGLTQEQINQNKDLKLEPFEIADAVKYVLSLPTHINVTELTIKPTGEKF